MFTDYKQQTQFELFPKAVSDEPRSKFKLPLKDLTLSPERIIVISIFGMMALLFAFALGLEKGKKTAALSFGQEKQSIAAQSRDVPGKVPLEQKIQTKPLPAPSSEIGTNKGPLNSIALQPSAVKAQYTIQVASFKSSKNAYDEAKILQQKGYQIFVLPKGSYSIVCVGKFFEEMEAKQFVNKLKNRYKDCVIRRL